MLMTTNVQTCFHKFKVPQTLKKSRHEFFFFCISFQSSHQTDMENVVECKKYFFGYVNALETHGGYSIQNIIPNVSKTSTYTF